MQTIWLQRSSPDIPWGFRLVGGREFGVPLSVQRVTPGSVAASALGPGDVILKVGNVMATNLEHNDAQELVRQASNILQLTIRKGDRPSPSGPLSPVGPGYGNYAQQNDSSGYGTTPRSFSTGIPINANYSRGNEAPNYATTPRSYGSQHQQPLNATRIEIQRVHPGQQQTGYSNNYYNEDNVNTGGSNFPDYTVAYRNQEPVHDSPGGPVNVRGYNLQNENTSYSSKSLPRDVGGYNSNDREGFGGASGPPAYEPRAYNVNQSPISPRGQSDSRFSTGLPFQPSHQKPQQSYTDPVPQSFQNTYNQVPSQPAYGSAPRSFNSPTSSAPVSQRNQTSSSTGYISREPNTPTSSIHNQTPFYRSDSSGYERDSGSNIYSSQPYSTPTYAPSNSSYNAYNSTPQPHSQTPYVPTQVSSSSTYEPPSAFSPSQSRPYQSPMSPGSSSGYSVPPASGRRVSFEQNAQENDPYTQPASFNVRSYKPSPPVSNSSAGHYDYGAADFGVSPPPSGRFSRQSSRQDDPYSTPSYTSPGGPMSPRAVTADYRGRGPYDPSGVSDGIENINLDSSPRFEPPPPVSAAPPPPPPPPPGPPPPPAPPLNEWNSTPFRRQNIKRREEGEEQKVPDQILNTMLKSAKGGGPKPFSYGIDLSELKKKIGPPTAPKPRSEQPNYQEDEEPDVPRQYGGPPRKPAGHVQSDYFVNRGDDNDPAYRSNKKPAGQVQSDYFHARQTGPRSEIDESPININMGTDPKKQSKSFKVLQWMTETDKDVPEEPSQKPRRAKDPERRHNADDDEMRFSGLHSKADIPSKAFGILQRISADDSRAATQNGKDTFDTAGGSREEREEDNLPETLSSEDMVDKRYKGGNIPSKVFKVLQKSVGDDTSETPSPPISRPSKSGQSAPKVVAPVSDF